MRSPLIALFLLPLLLSACKEDEALDPAAVARGKDLSQACTACHQLSGTNNEVGPNLAGIVGRKAGIAPGYEYSSGMKALAITWTPENLVRYLRDPFAMVPDTKMALGELSEQEATDVVTYLRSLD